MKGIKPDGFLSFALADRCTEVETGARNIDHIMRGTILPQLSEKILMQMSGKEMPSTVCLSVEKDGNFSFTFGDRIKPVKVKKKKTK